jgi:hypothetical protein
MASPVIPKLFAGGRGRDYLGEISDTSSDDDDDERPSKRQRTAARKESTQSAQSDLIYSSDRKSFLKARDKLEGAEDDEEEPVVAKKSRSARYALFKKLPCNFNNIC